MMTNALPQFFRAHPSNPGGLSTFRLTVMRLYFFLLSVAFGINVWTGILNHTGPWDPLHGVAYSFWAALSALALLGLRYPAKMILLPLLQFIYKLAWMVIVAYPLWSTGQLTDPYTQRLTIMFLSVMAIDLLVIPWPYLIRNFVL